jgi:hypothetical protein
MREKMNLSLTTNDWILCKYQNQAQQMQIIKITNINYWYLEKVIFPQENFLFSAPRQAKLEIYHSKNPEIMLADKIPCYQLEIKEKSSIKCA